MGFSKDKSQTPLAILVTHRWYPGTEFVFHFPKLLPQAALDAEKQFLGLKDSEREDEHRKSLINVVAEMVTAEPEGFDDFPGASAIAALKVERAKLEDALKSEEEDARIEIEGRIQQLEAEVEAAWRVSLQQRMRDYFDDPTQPELEAILASAWRAYKAAAIPAAYIKSAGDSGAQGGLSPQTAR